MKTFKFQCKKEKERKWDIYTVVGFKLGDDRMCLYFEDGSILELAKWHEYDCKLGTDYFDILKKQMESQAGQSIPTNEVRP